MVNQKAIDTIRMLSVDAIEKANSGHPGLPLGAAPFAYTLWADYLNVTAKDPKWPNRDRFVLSAGHGSMLLYSLLHLFDFDVTMEDIKNFRQLHSKTPGHPEYGHTEGVEVTTGPLGAGFSMAVGLALGERYMGAKYNKEDLKIIDHYTYVLCGDGDLMEGISNEAASLAGTQKLDKLIVLYDSNAITIEGSTDIAFTENVRGRFDALGWSTSLVEDGNDTEAISKAIGEAKKAKGPSLIEIKTNIGYGSPGEGTAKVHGSPLGGEGALATRKKLHMDGEEAFTISEEVRQVQKDLIAKKNQAYQDWLDLEKAYEEKYPQDYKELKAGWEGRLDLSFLEEEDFWKAEKDQATRASSGMILNRIAGKMPNFLGGSADLAPSNKTSIDGENYMSPENPTGRNMGFGVREHAMAAVANGLALYGGIRPYCATFLVFSDYMKPQLRLSALMGAPVTYIFTHDSIGVGEDGPTHQPIDQLPMLRSIPNLITFRPADTTEVAAAWATALKLDKTPLALSLTRQSLPELKETSKEAMKGGYIVKKEEGSLDLILLASGSELHLSLEVAEELTKEGLGVRVVSMPSWEIFEAQSFDYRQEILPEEAQKRVSIEAASTMGWAKFTGFQGMNIGIDEFGTSGPGEEVFQYFKLNKEEVVKEIHHYLGR